MKGPLKAEANCGKYENQIQSDLEDAFVDGILHPSDPSQEVHGTRA